VEDGTTVPIYYESRLPELRVEGETLDAVFERVFHDRSEQERMAIRSRYATLEAIAGAPKRIERICLDLIEHFEGFIHPNGFKAQVVACTRDAAVTYLETLERLGAPPVALIMSGGHDDPDRLARYHTTREQKQALIERFKHTSDPAMLVVCDMLLTGFDAPVEQVMYLDSPLKQHTLLQAIARVNRTAEGKTYGLVVDYWGVSHDLQDALSIFEPRDVEGALLQKADEIPRLEHRHRQVMGFFAKANRGDLEACLRVLEPADEADQQPGRANPESVAEEPGAYGSAPGTEAWKALASDILTALEDLTVIDWTRKDDIQREMRRRIKRHLRASGCSGERLEAVTAKLMDLARARLAR
jgi:type I restriction enzyme R subunit